MKIELVNTQRRDPVPRAWLTSVARRAAHRLGIAGDGQLPITFIDRHTMTTLNRRFTRHNHLTDVLSFRYPKESVVGEILIAPAAARVYARQHRLSYRRELARYVIHGLLHWCGYQDHTPAQQQRMRTMEEELLATCAR